MRSLGSCFLLYLFFILLFWLGSGYLHITLNIRRVILPCMPYLQEGVAKVTCKTTVPTDTVFKQIHISLVNWPEVFCPFLLAKSMPWPVELWSFL